MDPWLEHPNLWSGVHASLIIYMRDTLQPLLSPRYVAAVEERIYVSTNDRILVPDLAVRRESAEPKSHSQVAVLEPDDAVILESVEDEIHEPYLEILDLKSKQQVVTVIEIVSPSNKHKGPGRTQYLKKQREVLRSESNLVEIDLLRRGPHILAVPEHEVQGLGVYDYLVCVRRPSGRRQHFSLYPRTVRERLPRIAIPLKPHDPAITLDLQPLLDRTYEAALYEGRLGYDKPCIPRLRPDDEAWARERIAEWQAARQV
jgi:hypothetical protein